MPSRADLWLFFAGALASAVNAAAGGGTLLSFPSLMAAGLSPLAANATSTVGLLPGYVASLAGYRAEMRKLQGDVIFATIPSLAGGILGAWLLVRLGSAFFARIVPALLVAAAALLLLQPILARLLRRRPAVERPAVIFVAVLVVALYAGYFGAGAGILFLGAMGLLYQRDLGEVNAIKVFVSLLANVIAAATFVVLELAHPTGALRFRAALPLALGALAGGYVGVRVARRLSPVLLRGFAALIGVAIAVYFLFFRGR